MGFVEIIKYQYSDQEISDEDEIDCGTEIDSFSEGQKLLMTKGLLTCGLVLRVLIIKLDQDSDEGNHQILKPFATFGDYTAVALFP